jgi:hypothetical protein
MIKSVMSRQPPPYSDQQLDSIARQDAARKV